MAKKEFPFVRKPVLFVLGEQILVERKQGSERRNCNEKHHTPGYAEHQKRENIYPVTSVLVSGIPGNSGYLLIPVEVRGDFQRK